MSVYAAGALPGQFLPGADHAFETSALFALTALAVAVVGSPRRLRRRPVTEPCPEPCADQQRDLVAAA